MVMIKVTRDSSQGGHDQSNKVTRNRCHGGRDQSNKRHGTEWDWSRQYWPTYSSIIYTHAHAHTHSRKKDTMHMLHSTAVEIKHYLVTPLQQC